ncbi:MAG: aspartate aminotransferase family protein [Mycobacteriales bacterium]
MSMLAEHRPQQRSDELQARAVRRVPGGVNSNVRLSGPATYFARGRGAWLWDVDGNDYVDYLLGQGPSFLGHAHPEVNAAIAEACRRGMVYGAQHPLEVDAAERLCTVLGWPDMVRLGLSGTEMVQAALRLVRAATGRRRFVRFEGHYHGWLDNVLLATADGRSGPASAGQLASHLDDGLVLPWNDEDALAALLADRGEEVAAVIMEPMMLNAGAIQPRSGYLQRVRELCDAYGAVLIFDEVICGFRLALGGASEVFGVRPDLAVYGKAMAGGWPVAALAGRGALMERFGTGEVTHAGTFNGSMMAAAAVVATLEVLAGDPPYERIEAHGGSLIAGLRELAAVHDLPLRVQGRPVAFHASFGDPAPVWDHAGLQRRDAARYARFARTLARHGVWVAGRGVWYVSAAHGQAELTAVLERVDAALAAERP